LCRVIDDEFTVMELWQQRAISDGSDDRVVHLAV